MQNLAKRSAFAIYVDHINIQRAVGREKIVIGPGNRFPACRKFNSLQKSTENGTGRVDVKNEYRPIAASIFIVRRSHNQSIANYAERIAKIKV